MRQYNDIHIKKRIKEALTHGACSPLCMIPQKDAQQKERFYPPRKKNYKHVIIE